MLAIAPTAPASGATTSAGAATVPAGSALTNASPSAATDASSEASSQPAVSAPSIAIPAAGGTYHIVPAAATAHTPEKEGGIIRSSSADVIVVIVVCGVVGRACRGGDRHAAASPGSRSAGRGRLRGGRRFGPRRAVLLLLLPASGTSAQGGCDPRAQAVRQGVQQAQSESIAWPGCFHPAPTRLGQHAARSRSHVTRAPGRR